ncbi:MAG: hypothetical protein EP332_14245 [Bacteroidetes bacterium]|nr:MAG: hypothetical protein EP332_14245 [Bacteroidota bacterium]
MNVGTISCSHCGESIASHYCANYGQKYDPKKLNLFTLVYDLFANLLSLEKSVFSAAIRLFWNPHDYVQNYFNGFRSFYPSPGRMLLVALTIGGLQVALVSPELLGFEFSVENLAGQLAFFVVFVPVLSIISWLSGLVHKQSLIKHLISGIYLSSAYFITLQILLSIIDKLFDPGFGSFPGLLFILLFFLGSARIFNPGNPRRILLAFILQLVLMVALVYGVSSFSIEK